MPQESDSNSSDENRNIPGTVRKSTGTCTKREPLSSSEEPQARCEANSAESSRYPLCEESRDIREHVDSNSESQRIHGSSGNIYVSKKDNIEINSEDMKSEIAHGAKNVYPSKGTSEYESKHEHGARRKAPLFKEVTTKTRAERQPIAELVVPVDRSSNNTTSETDDLKSLEKVFGVSPPRKISPEPLRKRKVGSVEMKIHKTEAEETFKENYGDSSELEKQPKQTSSYKSRKQVDFVLGERYNQEEFKTDKHRASDAGEGPSFDRQEMQQEINSAVEELVAILNAIIKTSPESNLDVTPDDQEIGTEIGVDRNDSGESQRHRSTDEYRLKEPSTEAINFILGGCLEDSPNDSAHSVPESSGNLETLEAIKEIIASCFSEPLLESVDACEERTLEEVEVSSHGVSRRKLILNSDITEMDQPQNQNFPEEISEKSFNSNENLELRDDIEEQNLYRTQSSILEDSQRNEACFKNNGDSKSKESFMHGDEHQCVEVCMGEQLLNNPAASFGEPQPVGETVFESVSRSEVPQQMKERILHHGEPETVEKSVLDYEEPVVENVLHRSAITENVLYSKEPQAMEEIMQCEMPQPVEKRIMHHGEPHSAKEIAFHCVEPQPEEESSLHHGEHHPLEESIPNSGETDPVEERVLHSGEPQPVEESALQSDKKQQVEGSVLQSDQKQHLEENVLHSDKKQPVKESVLYHCEPLPVEESFLHSDEKQPVEESVFHSGNPRPVEESTLHSKEPQPVEESILHSDELRPVKESVLHRDEPQPVEESVLHRDEPQPVEESVLHRDEPQPVEESVLHRDEPQPVEESVLHRDEPQPVEESVLHRDEPQPVEESVLHRDEPQPMEESVLHRDEPQPVEESVLHSDEPQPVEESVSLREAYRYY
ncbi:protein P200-like [Uloborus diversus]|uniref:protein P200-like n=1 Tax=Uloborus diversus TaxID=327109 RepID=UPI002409686A|nr:protein P200-like [Uloborus diversus]